MLLCGLLVDGGAGDADGLGVELLRLPDKVLDEVSVVLGQQQILGVLDDLTNIGDEVFAFGRELISWARKYLGLEEAVQGNINLVILRPPVSTWEQGKFKAGQMRRTEGTLPSLKALKMP